MRANLKNKKETKTQQRMREEEENEMKLKNEINQLLGDDADGEQKLLNFDGMTHLGPLLQTSKKSKKSNLSASAITPSITNTKYDRKKDLDVHEGNKSGDQVDGSDDLEIPETGGVFGEDNEDEDAIELELYYAQLKEKEKESMIDDLSDSGDGSDKLSNDDVSDSDDDDALIEKIFKNEKEALEEKLKDVAESRNQLQSMTHTVPSSPSTDGSATAIESRTKSMKGGKEKDDADEDDLEMEMSFYAQAIKSTNFIKNYFVKNSLAFTRPQDYYAEMLKSDDHMSKVREKLIGKASSLQASEDAKRQRDLKKYGKKVQVAKGLERSADKKASLDQIKKIRKHGLGDVDDANGDDDQFDIQVDNGSGKAERNDRTSSGRGRGRGRDKDSASSRGKRMSKDSKYGFGGGKRNSKSNTSQSTDDISSFSIKKMKTSSSYGSSDGNSRGGRGGRGSSRGRGGRGGGRGRGRN